MTDPTPEDDLRRIVESAQRLGVELDEREALNWLTTMAVEHTEGDVTFDATHGVFGHRVSMMDFSPVDLERFRRIGAVVEIPDEPGVVETALALSGSAAQSKIQTYPGDCDYFERINVLAATRDEACRTLGRVIRDKALASASGPGYRLIEVKYGSYPADLVVGGERVAAGSPVSWTVADVERGAIDATTPDGEAAPVTWESVADEPGWCKLDWVITDPVRRQVANASNMLDATWQAPDGTITPLDGYLDPYFQEVYLDAASVPIFSKVVRHVSGDSLDEYVEQLEHEVEKYLTHDVNYGKAAKRMYNVFRLTGRYEEAAFLRELFDEPATLLYQVWSLVRSIDDVLTSGASVAPDELVSYADELIGRVEAVLDGPVEDEIVRRLQRLRAVLGAPHDEDDWNAAVDAARAEAINVVNNFFHERLQAVPEVRDYMAGFPRRAGARVSSSAVDAVRAANQAFYDAHEARDLDAMAAVWEHSDRAVCIHPGWPILRGWPLIVESWRRIFGGPGRSQFILTDVVVTLRGDLAWVTLDENLVDQEVAGAIAATNLYVLTASGWRLTLHHGSPVMAR